MSAAPSTPTSATLGIVVIGRNEGERLRRCFQSLPPALPIVYVDSGSSDGSRELARQLGVELVELDLSTPFTAARARNAGFERLLGIAPALKWVQFLDGDCELDARWLERARVELERDMSVAVVCGRRRERFPEASPYNRLCDLEWDTPIGEASSCGGDALMRAEALRAVGGYDPGLIAGEEPELCFRLRQRGLRILRIDAEMTLHDAAMTSFGQWWQRAKRAGHAAAEGAQMHWRDGDRRAGRRVLSAFAYAVVLPWVTLATLLLAGWLSLPSLAIAALAFALGVYVFLSVRVYLGRRRSGNSPADARLYARFCVLGKWAETAGAFFFWRNHARGERAALIEYKRAGVRA